MGWQGQREQVGDAALKASELGAKLGPAEANMVKALCDKVTSIPTSVRPVQRVKAWLLRVSGEQRAGTPPQYIYI